MTQVCTPRRWSLRSAMAFSTMGPRPRLGAAVRTGLRGEASSHAWCVLVAKSPRAAFT